MFRVDHSNWEDGSGYSYTETIDTLESYSAGDAQEITKAWIEYDPEHDYSGDKFKIINNDTDEVVDSFTVK